MGEIDFTPRKIGPDYLPSPVSRILFEDNYDFNLQDLNEEPISLTDPAAGAEINHQLGADEYFLIKQLQFRLITSATAATRSPRAYVEDESGRLIWTSGDIADQIATLTRDYICMEGPENYARAKEIALAWPMTQTFVRPSIPVGGLLIGPNFRIRTNTANIQVGDDYSLVVSVAKRTKGHKGTITGFAGSHRSHLTQLKIRSAPSALRTELLSNSFAGDTVIVYWDNPSPIGQGIFGSAWFNPNGDANWRDVEVDIVLLDLTTGLSVFTSGIKFLRRLAGAIQNKIQYKDINGNFVDYKTYTMSDSPGWHWIGLHVFWEKDVSLIYHHLYFDRIADFVFPQKIKASGPNPTNPVTHCRIQHINSTDIAAASSIIWDDVIGAEV